MYVCTCWYLTRTGFEPVLPRLSQRNPLTPGSDGMDTALGRTYRPTPLHRRIRGILLGYREGTTFGHHDSKLTRRFASSRDCPADESSVRPREPLYSRCVVGFDHSDPDIPAGAAVRLNATS